ncbi:MAG: uroporphyrinogen decarboxylase family protein [Kiritimatiellae bacterium]|nr:uroporphyrinogen decarboxylase family protein [Verrucomicrobiota bacterium]MCG2681321.1 uroporphyrinogen decarboxylase family protein [Kiritimatiellia bacterium]
MMQELKLSEDVIKRHNADTEEVWAAFRSGKPTRVPVVGGVSIRHYLNMRRLSFRRYFTDPEFMMQCQLELQKFNRACITGDSPVGVPEKWDGISVDFQDQYEEGWLGCEIVYIEDDVFWTRPILAEDKSALSRLKIPDPLADNLMGRITQYYQLFRDRSALAQFEDRTIGPPRLPFGTNGPFTLAVSLRGADKLCLDIYEDPGFVHALLEFVTEAIVTRIKACRDLMGLPYPCDGYGFADDAIVMLSPQIYEEFVLPHHQKLVAVFSRPGAANSCHFCGPIEKHARILYDKLNIRDIETGFPTDFDKLKAELGSAVTYTRTVHPRMLWDRTPTEIDQVARDILESSVREGLRLAVRVFNAIAPGTPVEKLKLFYQAARKYGRYE